MAGSITCSTLRSATCGSQETCIQLSQVRKHGVAAGFLSVIFTTHVVCLQ
jgi:hypothetical protein